MVEFVGAACLGNVGGDGVVEVLGAWGGVGVRGARHGCVRGWFFFWDWVKLVVRAWG